MMLRRMKVGVLVVMSALVSGWLLLAVTDAAAQQGRETGINIATQAAIDRAISANTNAITEIRGDIRQIAYVANDAREEVRSMRNAVIGMAGTILVSLFMQLAQLRKQKGQA